LRELFDGYEVTANLQLATRVYQQAHAMDDPHTAKWAAERRCAQFRPPPKQIEVKTDQPLGMNVVLSRGDGTVIPPPTPEEADAG
jgi:hypothetical protein